MSDLEKGGPSRSPMHGVPRRCGHAATAEAVRRDSRPCDEKFLAHAMRAHEKILRALARRILRDDDLAEDAIQEALISLYQMPEAPPSLRAWLVRTVIHRSLHARRSHARRRHWEARSEEGGTEGCPLCDPARQLEFRRLLQQIEHGLSSLSDSYRRVFLLRAFDGLDYGEIARETGLPVGTVRSRLSRARQALRENLAPDGEAP